MNEVCVEHQTRQYFFIEPMGFETALIYKWN